MWLTKTQSGGRPTHIFVHISSPEKQQVIMHPAITIAPVVPVGTGVLVERVIKVATKPAAAAPAGQGQRLPVDTSALVGRKEVFLVLPYSNGTPYLHDTATNEVRMLSGAYVLMKEGGRGEPAIDVCSTVHRIIRPIGPPDRTKRGAGVLLVEMYTRAPKTYGVSPEMKTEPAVILFLEKTGTNKGKYADPGGDVDSGESPMASAQRELAEESLGLFRIDLANAINTGVFKAWDTNDIDYTTFVVPVAGPKGVFEVVKYTENLKHIAAQVNAPSAWKETNGMARFFLRDLITANVMTKKADLENVKDVNGTTCIITGRAKGIIREALKRHLLVETHVQQGYNQLQESQKILWPGSDMRFCYSM
jgi:hypothetical protein